MFILTQLLGLAVVNFYLNPNHILPYGFDSSKTIQPASFLIQLIFSFIITVVIILMLMKIRSEFFMKLWFFVVVSLAIAVSMNAMLSIYSFIIAPTIIALIIGVIFSYFKIFRMNILIHNITEVMVYPGIAALFVTMLNIKITIILLLIISVYDMWAVWKSKIMVKMAKYQINTLGIFGGFLIAHANKKIKEKIRLLKQKYKNNIPDKILKKNKIKIQLAILGGGDIVFSIIAAGVFLKTYQSFVGSLVVILFASLALLYLYTFGKKNKSYPAMPYLTTGILIGMAISKIFLI